ncbi:MAG TPA: DUF2147 domain-containing protein [Roseiarcus sp.]|nr:DUF2147 domain-containing protein [Roseiarcus sp.]
MIKVSLLAAFGAALALSPALAAEPFGTFVRPSTGAQVKFYDCGGKLCGKVVNVKDASRAKEVGTVILNGAAKSGDNQWKGSLLDTDNGKTYSGVVTLESPDALNLKGCVAMICQGETWRRVQ